jgi:hypothetical protein
METDGTLIGEWALPGQDQEGIALKGSELYITEDYGGDGGDVLRYAPFVVIPQPDLDADGKVNLTDLALLSAHGPAKTNPSATQHRRATTPRPRHPAEPGSREPTKFSIVPFSFSIE